MHPRRREVIGIALVVVAGACYAAATVATKLAYRRGAAPGTLVSVRFVGSALAVGIAARAIGAPWRIDRRRARSLAMVGALSALMALLFFGSLERIPASTATLLLYTHPAMVALAAFLLGRESMGRTKLAALSLALGGVALVVGAPAGTLEPLGVAMALGGAVALAAFVVAAQGVIAGLHPLVASASVLGAAAVAFTLPAAAAGALRAPREGIAWAWMGAVALATAAAVTLFLAAVDRLGPTRATIGATVEPLFTVILAMAALDESLSALQIVGGALVVAAVAILPLTGRRALSVGSGPPAAPPGPG